MNDTIRYTEDLAGTSSDMLTGFFEGWPDPPSPEDHLRILQGSAHVVLAIDDDAPRIVGFVSGISDGVMSAYLPLLEVLPAYRGQGIGRELVRRILARLDHLYMVDVVCDPEVVPFYEQFGLKRGTAMMKRTYQHQACRQE